MVSVKLWIKKLLFYKKRSLIILLFLILPLILFSSSALNFLNGYFKSFEEYSYIYISNSDILVYSDYSNFKDIDDGLKLELSNYPYRGCIVDYSFSLDVNLTIHKLDQGLSFVYLNHSMNFLGLNFSQNNIKSFYINTYIPLISGRLPNNTTEVILPIEYQIIYNLSINSLLNLKYTTEINQNLTIVGFFKSNQNTFFSPKNQVLFFINDLNSSLFQKSIGSGQRSSRYNIFLDHRQMDIFNLNLFVLELEQIESIIRLFFVNNIPGQIDVSSSSSSYLSDEVGVYLKTIYDDLIAIIIPIILIIIIFASIPSNYISNIEKEYWWNKIDVYTSKNTIRTQLLLEILLNVFLAFLIGLPSGIGLFFIINFFSDIGQVNLNLFIPTSFYFSTITFSIFYAIFIYYSLLRAHKKEKISKMQRFEMEPKNLFRKRKLLVSLIVLISLLPIIERILYIGLVSYYNPLLSSIILPLGEFANYVSLFYSTTFILLVLLTIPSFIIRFVQLMIKKMPFTKVRNASVELMSKLFQFKKKNIIILIAILSLQIGFINFYSFNHGNQYVQGELEVYLDYGSDYKLYEPYSNKSLINFSLYTENLIYSQIDSISGRLENGSIADQNIVLISLNTSRYTSVLTQKVLQNLSQEMISSITSLGDNEILVPIYLQYRYDLKIGDYLTFQPENTSNSLYEFLENYSITMYIKGFFNYLPGLDHDINLSPSLYYFQRRMIFISKSNFNFSSYFGDLPIKRTYLIKDLNNSLNIIKSLIHNNPYLQYISLKDGLDDFNNSYLAVSNQTVNNIFKIYIILFIIEIFFFIYYFIKENSNIWNLFQLFGQKASQIKHFILKSLVSIIFISLLIGLLGFITGYLVFLFENINFKFYYYLYPITFYFDFNGLIFNVLFFFASTVLIWLIIYKLARFKFTYKDLKKYNPE